MKKSLKVINLLRTLRVLCSFAFSGIVLLATGCGDLFSNTSDNDSGSNSGNNSSDNDDT